MAWLGLDEFDRSGRLDEAARILYAGTVIAGPGGQHERADCTARLALVEALRGRLGRAADLAAQAGAGSAAQKRRRPSKLVPG